MRAKQKFCVFFFFFRFNLAVRHVLSLAQLKLFYYTKSLFNLDPDSLKRPILGISVDLKQKTEEKKIFQQERMHSAHTIV